MEEGSRSTRMELVWAGRIEEEEEEGGGVRRRWVAGGVRFYKKKFYQPR